MCRNAICRQTSALSHLRASECASVSRTNLSLRYFWSGPHEEQRDRRKSVETAPAADVSARPTELLFNSTVGGRLCRELVERRTEEILGLFASTLAAVDEAQVGDHASLVLHIPEFPKDDERLLEVLKRCRVAGMSEC
jgi:hypothetical protein